MWWMYGVEGRVSCAALLRRHRAHHCAEHLVESVVHDAEAPGA